MMRSITKLKELEELEELQEIGIQSVELGSGEVLQWRAGGAGRLAGGQRRMNAREAISPDRNSTSFSPLSRCDHEHTSRFAWRNRAMKRCHLSRRSVCTCSERELE